MATGGHGELEKYDQYQQKGTSASGLERDEHDKNPEQNSELRLIIFGKTGTGKSSTGNTILGRQGFKQMAGPGAQTKQCRKQQVKLNGRNVTIVDTPGVSDPQRDPMETLHEISKSLLFLKPGPHALLFVINADARFTDEEEDAYFAIRNLFASHLKSYLIVVFTHFDAFGNNQAVLQQRLEKYGKEVDAAKQDNRTLPDIRKVLDDVDGRQVMFSNTADEALKDQQVLHLLDVIQDVADTNHKPFFQDKDTETAAQSREKVIQDIQKEDFRQTLAQVWKRVKKSEEIKRKQLLKPLKPREEPTSLAWGIVLNVRDAMLGWLD